MCGRYSLNISLEQLLAFFHQLHLHIDTLDPFPRINIAPSDLRPHGLPVIRRAPVIYRQHEQNHLAESIWRLIPRWNHGQFVSYNTINAKSETLLEKRMYHAPWLDSQRCLVPATGVIEWQAASHGPKRPHHLSLSSSSLFSMGGIWESSVTRSGHLVHSFAILTTAPSPSFAKVHDRMPVVIKAEDYGQWLTGSPEQAAELCQTYPEAFQAQLIGRGVNNPAAHQAELLQALSEEQWQAQLQPAGKTSNTQQSLF